MGDDPMEWDTGAAAWMLMSASLVLLMTPGLAFFYGGMVRAKSVLNMMMMSFGAMGVIGVIYVLWGWSMSYGSSVLGLFGNPFDQFGVELGKEMAKGLAEGTIEFDSATQALMQAALGA